MLLWMTIFEYMKVLKNGIDKLSTFFRTSKFREGSRVRQAPEEGRKTYRLKPCGNNYEDADNSSKRLNDKNLSIYLSLFLI